MEQTRGADGAALPGLAAQDSHGAGPGPRIAWADGMLDQIVHYLKAHDVSFRLSSAPSPEPLPEVAHPVPPGGLVVETQVLLVGGRAALAVMPRGAKLSLPRLVRELGAVVIDGAPADLPPPYSRSAGRIPPFGGAMGILTIVDEEAAKASSLVFTAFVPSDAIEVPYDDFARVERPRVASFAIGGELPSGSEAQEVTKKVA